ncbi:MAG: hypothetical protein VR78_11070 [Hoeflea sp. BRH_c9]|nr:MAG: hypothetical protein VR78_11070 [Hoeflea sp. BRH_c9]
MEETSTVAASEDASTEAAANKSEQSLSFKEFLEGTHPSVFKPVHDLWEKKVRVHTEDERELTFSDIRLHCRICEGERTFRATRGSDEYRWSTRKVNLHPIYLCGDCQNETKYYALQVAFGDDGGSQVYKFGEIPAFGIPVSNRLLRLFGNEDASLFLKGRQCENLGYGVAAFAYYRRVVENHKNDLFNEIIKVCRTVGASAELINELEAAKREISFSKSIEKIKAGLPEGLLIDGHNPLNALHNALSVGLHNEADEDCLSDAQAVRLVLGELVDRIALLKQENRELTNAVQRLLAKKK